MVRFQNIHDIDNNHRGSFSAKRIKIKYTLFSSMDTNFSTEKTPSKTKKQTGKNSENNFFALLTLSAVSE